MEYRAEPRFPVRSPIRVIVPGNPARILNCDLIDVSATGMRFLSAESVPPDEIVAIEVDSRLVLAEIRYCQTRGDKFVAGVQRLQEIAKGAELKDPGACATEMIRDLRQHISAGGERDPKALAMNALQKIVDRSEIPAGGNESDPQANPAGNTVELLPPEPIPSQPSPQAAYGKATNGNAGDHRETPAVAISNDGELDEMPGHEPIGAAPIEVREVLTAGVTEVAEADAPPESESAEIEFQEPAQAAIGETLLQEQAATVPHILQAEVIEPDVIKPDVIEPDVIEGDVLEGDDADKPLADVPAEPVSAGIEFRAPVVAERPPVAEGPTVVSNGRMNESVSEAAEIAEAKEVATVARVPIGLHASAGPGATQETDPLAARRAEIEASYLAEDTSSAPVRDSRSWRVPVAIAAALVLACAIAFFLVQRRTQASSLAPPNDTHAAEVAPSPAPAAPATPAEPAAPPASLPSPDQPPAKKAGVHHARIKIIEASWVTLVVDGGQPLQTMLYKGDVHDFDFSQKAFLRVGNAPGVEITFDGAPIGPLKGNVLLLTFTPDGVQFPKAPPSAK